jgi:hypothetical protein
MIHISLPFLENWLISIHPSVFGAATKSYVDDVTHMMLSDIQYAHKTVNKTFGAYSSYSASASCPDSYVALGGGPIEWEVSRSGIVIMGSSSIYGGWWVSWKNITGNTIDARFVIRAVCAKVNY